MTDRCLHLCGIAALIGLSACASEGHYACPVPEGDGGCHSVAQVYHETLAGPLPATPSSGLDRPPLPRAPEVRRDGSVERIYAAAVTPAVMTREPAPGAALLTTPHVLRVLVAPWQDDDGDLQAGGFLYLRLDQGQWTISR